ncbi:hypothetical protein ABPG75_006158 [Micractinium tetrahymenae]
MVRRGAWLPQHTSPTFNRWRGQRCHAHVWRSLAARSLPLASFPSFPSRSLAASRVPRPLAQTRSAIQVRLHFRRLPHTQAVMALPEVLQKRWVQVVLVTVAALWAHKKWRYSRYASRPYPDAWCREPSEHRRFITGLPDFVDLYAQRLPEGAEDQLEGELGVHTRCYTTQLALVAYFCGTKRALASQAHDVYTSADLLALVQLLQAASPAQRGEVLARLLGRGAAASSSAGGAAAGSAAAAAAGHKAGSTGASDAEGDEDDDEDSTEDGGQAAGEEEASALDVAGLAAAAPPQLVFRVHVDGDSVAGHTFVITSWGNASA